METEKNGESPKEQVIKKFVSDNSTQITDKNPVIIIREGSAPKQLDVIKPNKVHLVGVISSPSEFYNKRKHLHDPNKCHVVYDLLKGSIFLVLDENYENDNYAVVGIIQNNSELKKFEVNTGVQFEPKDLLRIIKFNRIYFEDQTEHAKICLALQNFKAKVATSLENSNDLRGEKLNTLHSKITHELQESFVLDINIFKGQPKIKFKVDICVELRAGEVYVYLESVQLRDLEMSTKEGILRTELEHFKDIVCIEQ
ncbi:MAG: hypothetical protein V4538_16400 [Bacteroidota bacterium]